MKDKKATKPATEPEPKPRPCDGVPTIEEFGKFVGKILNVPKAEIDAKSPKQDNHKKA